MENTYISDVGSPTEDGAIFINEKAFEHCIAGVRFMSDNPTSSVKKITPVGTFIGFSFSSQDMRYSVERKLAEQLKEIVFNHFTGKYEKA
jgi:hypothetical protein